MAIDRTPLFVRLSAPLISELDARIRADGRSKQAVVEALLSEQLHAPDRADDEILDLAGVAALLRVGEQDVLARIADGDFPARRFGSTWRCSRTAITAWLHGTDHTGPRSPGFASA